MKALKRFTGFALTLTLGVILSGSGCTGSSNPLSGSEVDASAVAGGTLGKYASLAMDVAITTRATVEPDSMTTLHIKGKNINNARFCVASGNVSTPTAMSLTKLNKVSNVYRLEPAGLSFPKGVEITLDFDHSAMPIGVSAKDLTIYQVTNGRYDALKSRVNVRKMQVRATARSSGEFVLGAYDAAGTLHIIEGEFGVRKDAWIKPNKGGTIHLGGGSSLTIPRGALNRRTLIGIIATRETLRGRGDVKAFTFTPHGTVFNVPIRLVLNWSELEGQPVELMYFNEQTQKWELSAQGVWDATNQTLTLEINHFSRYAFAWSR